MNENYLSGKCIYIYILAKYISKDVDVYYSLKKIYSPHVLKTFNNLSRDAYFSTNKIVDSSIRNSWGMGQKSKNAKNDDIVFSL